MKFLVTVVNGQLGHDVMNELHIRGHQGGGLILLLLTWVFWMVQQ